MENQASKLGHVHVSGASISYCSCLYPSWKIDLDNIKLIGEATNEDGPYCEDHFLLFILGLNDCFELPFGADGFAVTVNYLARRLGISLEPKLAFSTSFASTILWPTEMRNNRLFCYFEERPESLYRKILALFGIRSVTLAYDPKVKKYLADTL